MPCSDFIRFVETQHEWSMATFGPGAFTESITGHIKLEADEIRANPTDIHEWADVIILAISGATRAGYSAEDVWRGMLEKQRINFGRTYPTPTNQTEPTEHARAEL